MVSSKLTNGLRVFSLQKDPQKRPTAGQLLEHPFVKKYSDADADLIFWLKDYQDVYSAVTKKNLEQ